METITNKTLEKLKYDLVRDGLCEYEMIEKAQELASAQNVNIGQILIDTGILTEETLLKFLEAKLHIPYLNLEDYSLDKNCLKFISLSDAIKYKIIPLFKIEDSLTIAMADPLNLFAIDDVLDFDGEIEAIISSESSIIKKIEEYYSTENSVGKIHLDEETTSFDWTDELHNDDLSDEHIQKIIRAILKQALFEDVHEVCFEQTENGLGVNFKKNSEFENKGYIPSTMVISFVSKLKTLSDLDPTVSEVPQLGKLSFKVDEMSLIASISAFPTITTERISLKIYKPPQNLNDIILDQGKIISLEKNLNKPGIILVCGAPLCGKTHIIYSVLNHISQSNKNIMTIESISKYNLPNINQCEINENIGFNLDKALRFIEFQSPDILYVEGVTTKQALDYLSSLVFKDKTIITEFLANNMTDLREKMSYPDFKTFKSLISCLIFIHSKDSIEIIDQKTAQKYLT